MEEQNRTALELIQKTNKRIKTITKAKQTKNPAILEAVNVLSSASAMCRFLPHRY